MSDTVKLSSRLPGDPEINGLDAIANKFHEEGVEVCLAWLVPRDVRRNIATGDEVPTVEIRRIEPLGSPHEVPQAIIDLANRVQERRTGRTPLPFDAIAVPKGEVLQPEADPVRAGDVAEQVIARDPGDIANVFAFDGQPLQ